jgi:hypothetical protein
LPILNTELIIIHIRIIFRSHAKVDYVPLYVFSSADDPYAEAAADQKLDARHVIEEAMSELTLLLPTSKALDASLNSGSTYPTMSQVQPIFY